MSLIPGNQPNDLPVLCTTDGVTQHLPGPPLPVHLLDPNLYPVTHTQLQSDCDPHHSDQYSAGARGGGGGAGMRSVGADTITSHVLKPELNSAYAILFSETSLSDNSNAGYGVFSGGAGGRHGEGAVGEVAYISNNLSLTI